MRARYAFHLSPITLPHVKQRTGIIMVLCVCDVVHESIESMNQYSSAPGMLELGFNGKQQSTCTHKACSYAPTKKKRIGVVGQNMCEGVKFVSLPFALNQSS